MAIGYRKWRDPRTGAIVLLPVVNLGASPLPSKLHTQVAAGLGELPLVYPGDNRGSGIRVRLGGVTYEVAKDERTSIVHGDDVTASVSFIYFARTTRTVEKYLGATTFNRVTRIEGRFSSVGANTWCDSWDPFESPFHYAAAEAWLKIVGGGVTYNTAHLFVDSAGNHPILDSWWQSGWRYTSGSVAIDLPPGRYDVYMVLYAVGAGSSDHVPTAEASATLDYWTEIARG